VGSWAGRHAKSLHAAAIVLGWVGVTAGVAPLLARLGFVVWPLSLGLLLLSLAGWGHLRVLFGAGLYTLSRPRQ
jgi:hypothetical protein